MRSGSRDIPATITVHVPLSFATRGGRRAVLTRTSAKHPIEENALLKAFARAYRWRRLIESGEFASITELAQAQGVNQSYACRLLRLTLLSPEIVQGVLDHRAANLTTLDCLMKPLPVIWTDQLSALADRQSVSMTQSGRSGIGHDSPTDPL